MGSSSRGYVVAVCLFLAAAWAGSARADTEVLACPGAGSGGDRADLRGIRFTVEEGFSAVEVRMDASAAGTYGFGAELRRSTGFLGEPEKVAAGLQVAVPGTFRTTPYVPVRIELGPVDVSGPETFTLKFVDITGPGRLFFEVFGIGSEPCPGVEVTEENDVANPTVRTDPPGFRALAGGGPVIASAYTTSPPTIDGVVGFGEWPVGNRIELAHGFLTVVNDRHRLYVLVDLLEDSGDDGGVGDFFWLSFDVDGDGAITPGVDLMYNLVPSTGNMRYQYYQGPSTWTGLQPETFSSKAKGFGCFFGDGSRTFGLFPHPGTCNAHRVWELGIDLMEIDAAAGDTVKMGLRVVSGTPAFDESLPELFWTGGEGFASSIQVQLGPPTDFIAAPFSTARIELLPDPVEVTQAIQTRGNDLPLVADKTTVARVYVDLDWPGPPPAPLQPSIVSLYGSRGGVDLPGSPLAFVHHAPLAVDREDLGDTANFKLPPTWNEGSVTLRAVVRSLFGAADASGNLPVVFTPKETPVYWVVPINTGTAASPVLPSNAEIESQQSYTEAVFPVPDIRWVRKPWQDIGPTTVGDTIRELNDYYGNAVLAWIFGVLFTGESPFDLPDQIYGFTPSGGGLSDPDWGGGVGHVARGFRGSSREGTMAHEIVHNLGTGDCATRATDGMWGRHVSSRPRLSAADDPTGQCVLGEAGGILYGCSAGGPDPDWQALFNDDDIGEVGFDTREPWMATAAQRTVVPATVPDFMSYCQSGFLPTKWISPYRWENLFDRFATVSAAGARAQAVAALRNAIQDVLYVSGEVTAKGTGALRPIQVAPGLPEVPRAEKSPYALELVGARGQLLRRWPFLVSFVDVEGEPREVVPFQFRLPLLDGIAAVRLVLEGEILAEIKVSESPPRVKILSPNGGEVWKGRRQVVEWTAADDDRDPLSFSLFYSPDEGRSWRPLAAHLGAGRVLAQEEGIFQYEVDPSALPGGDREKGGETALIRVVATDGFHTATDDSDAPFVVPTQPPQVEILEPADGTEVRPGQRLRFRGTAADAEDETLLDEAHVWSFDDTVFGTGPEVEAVLPPGRHTVSLTVFDRDGEAGADAVQVLVAEPCTGDFDGDGDVDGRDARTMAGQLGCEGRECVADFDGDGVVDEDDLAAFGRHYGRDDCPQALR
ncbi:MAG: hypothetical protein Kow0092_29370 [Deferrisomatales bacterium]